jgi:hypothetical protein
MFQSTSRSLPVQHYPAVGLNAVSIKDCKIELNFGWGASVREVSDLRHDARSQRRSSASSFKIRWHFQVKFVRHWDKVPIWSNKAFWQITACFPFLTRAVDCVKKTGGFPMASLSSWAILLAIKNLLPACVTVNCVPAEITRLMQECVKIRQSVRLSLTFISFSDRKHVKPRPPRKPQLGKRLQG